jgi:YfiH family protein
MVTIADCFPVFMYNPAQKSIALAHAGWRGIRENILPNTVSMLSDHLAIKATSLIVYVGPGIHSCHFKVGEDFADDFKKKFGSEIVSTNHDGLSVDLPLVIRRQLIAAGVQEDNIEISDYCTACNELLFSSFRRDRGGYIAQGAVIGMI